MRVQRTSRRLRWSAWDEGARIEPRIDCQVPYHSQPLDRYITGFYRLAAGSLWRPTPEEPLLVAIEQMGKRLSSLIPENVRDWLSHKPHVVLESTEPTIPWELAHLQGEALWKRITLTRSPFPTEFAAPAQSSPLRCLILADGDGTLSFTLGRAQALQQILGHSLDIEILSGTQTALESLRERLLLRPPHILMWNANHLTYGENRESHVWMHDRPFTPEQFRKQLKAPLPPLVILGWYSLPDLGFQTLRTQQIDDWAVALQERGAEVILASAWDDESTDDIWLEFLRNFARGSTLFISLHEARRRFMARSCSHSLLVYAGRNMRLASLTLELGPR